MAQRTIFRILGRVALFGVVAFELFGPALGSAMAQEPHESAEWWIKRHGVADPDWELAKRAQSVFDQVLPAAERRQGTFPRLYILKRGKSPEALALRDGTVLVNKAALELCYRGDRKNRLAGDTRLAFVLAHELQHLAAGDFSHFRGFMVRLEQEDSSSDGEPRASEILGEAETIESRSSRELMADKAGVHTLLFAGFDPQDLFNSKKNFFEEWTEYVGQLGAQPAIGAPPPSARHTVVKSTLQEVAASYDLFHFGTRLLQLGRYQDAIRLLTAYREQFPGTQVLNNLGAAHYQRAAIRLAACDGRLVTRYKLPLILDAETVSERARLRGSGDSPCYQNRVFREEIGRAIGYFDDAAQRSPGHVPSRLNLVSANILSANGAAAFEPAAQARDLAPDDPLVRTAMAIVGYEFATKESNARPVDEYLAEFEDILEATPDLPEALYARAAILTYLKRAAAARAAWQGFLDVESRGVWADYARERLAIEPLGVEASRPRNDTCFPAAPLPLGPTTPETRKLLEGFRTSPLTGSGRAYLGSGLRVLEIGESVELIERNWKPGATWPDDCGQPNVVVTTSLGEIQVFDGMALEMRDRRPHAQIFFGEVPEP